MNDTLLLIVEVLDSREDLADDQFGFLFCNLLIFLQVVVEIRPRTQLQDGAERVVVDLNSVKMLHHPAVVELLMDFVLPQRVLDVVVLHLVTPAIVEVMDLASHLLAQLNVESAVNF